MAIGRGCVGNPWIFGHARALWRKEPPPRPPAPRRRSSPGWRHPTPSRCRRAACRRRPKRWPRWPPPGSARPRSAPPPG
ncbi:MAG: hypothetical protein JOZ07_15935 [Solirubrobacterales bacterium]|nr:hypothetical protein [Solirubrobacterales bacterium]